jgi:hypothetical protein
MYAALQNINQHLHSRLVPIAKQEETQPAISFLSLCVAQKRRMQV